MAKLLLLTPFISTLLIVVFATIALWLLFMKGRSMPDLAFKNLLHGIIGDFPGRVVGLDRASYDSLKLLLNGGQVVAIADINRVEIEVDKLDHENIMIAIMVLLSEKLENKMIRLEGKTLWHFLPNQYRRDFIKSNKSKISFTAGLIFI